MAGFESLYSQFGKGSGRDKSMLKNVYANPGKYTEQQIRDAYRGALSVNRRDERFYKDIGSDDEDLVFQEDRYNTARNTYQSGLNNLLIRAKATPPPAPPKPKPKPAPSKEKRATIDVKAPSTPKVETGKSVDQVAVLQKALADAQTSFQTQLSQQGKTYQSQLADYQDLAKQQLRDYQDEANRRAKTLQQQAAESQRQMMIGLAQRDHAPAEVKMASSGTAQQGLTRRGTTGYFGRQGMRIGSLNVPSSGLTISTDAAVRAASGSFM